MALRPNGPLPMPAELQECISQVRALGFHSMITSALDTREAPAFLSAGFVEHDRLRVLSHDLDGIPSRPRRQSAAKLRRGRRQDRAACLSLDNEAFPPFWRMDEVGLTDARSATPASRFRVALDRDRVSGYAVTGRAGQQGFLQRLAVDPSCWRSGIGTALTLDSLRWCARRGCRATFVNTQISNEAALSLYENLGFEATPNDMVVLVWNEP